MIVVTYIDEAGTHGMAPHMVMGALVGRLDTFVCTKTPQSSFMREVCYHAAKC